MPHVSRYKLDQKTQESLIRTLDLVLTKLNKEEEVKDFLLSLLTPTERIMLAKRLAIITLLKEDVLESRIAQTLHVTRITVSRMQLFLEARGKGYEVAFEKVKEEEFMQNLRSVLLKLAAYSIRAAGGRVKPTIF